MFAAEIVTADAPVLVNVSERLVLLLVCTLPKESVDDDAARVEIPLEPTGSQPLATGKQHDSSGDQKRREEAATRSKNVQET
jgi:hypothetical protein